MDVREECLECGKLRILNEENLCAECWNKKVRLESERERLEDEEDTVPISGIPDYDPELNDEDEFAKFERMQNRLDDSNEMDDDLEKE